MRIAIFATALSLLLAAVLSAQAPNTDIYLAPFARAGDSLVVGVPVNVTRRAGYDNQPSFTPDSRSILYTAQSDGQTDIWRYDLDGRRTSRVTSTPESEYSATVMPGGTRFSVIRVERDSAQRLWSFALDGSDPQLVLRDVRPVGYHLWFRRDLLLVFLLGTPSTLQVANTRGLTGLVIDRNVGRSFNSIPGGGISYTTRIDTAPPSSILMRGYAFDGGPARLASVPADNEFHTWTPDGLMLTASKGVLLRWNGVEGDGSRWNPVADLAPHGVKNVTRLAVSPDGKWLAFVAEPVAP